MNPEVIINKGATTEMTEAIQKRRDAGFSIVEVMIVLAIAGLIIVIVFLAVPALQRNSRNSARQADASRIVAAVNECLGQNNGRTANCDVIGEISPAYIDMANNSQLTAVTVVATGGTMPAANAANLNTAVVAYGRICDGAGTAFVASGGTRAVSVGYVAETANGQINRCVGS